MKKARKVLEVIVILNIYLSLVSWPHIASAGTETAERILIDFKNTDERENWQIINDDVMGGISRSEIIFNDTGTATFQGRISLENNGGFASTRSKSHLYGLGGYIGLDVRIRGDGNDYQLRVRTDNRLNGISYRYRFATQPGTWMNIRVPFSEFVAVFRGRILSNVSPISPEQIQQIGFLISDKQAGKFRIEIDWIKAYR
ncbi:MAG: CIA30 family protein [Deltaproteobacteria bacterium]|nr:CIA30 family protein [Deltaproteobacteria bacterium]